MEDKASIYYGTALNKRNKDENPDSKIYFKNNDVVKDKINDYYIKDPSSGLKNLIDKKGGSSSRKHKRRSSRRRRRIRITKRRYRR